MTNAETNKPGPVSVHLEFTPNPDTLKFVVNQTLLSTGSAQFNKVEDTEGAPLAKNIFGVPGIRAVFVGRNFVTITKSPDGDWDTIADQVPKTIESHLTSESAFDSAWLLRHAAPVATSGDVETRIRAILDADIRPAVAMDGGDITFGRYEDGVVFLHLQGACSSCPSSIATLKMGVETRLKEAIPEIKEVVQIA